MSIVQGKKLNWGSRSGRLNLQNTSKGIDQIISELGLTSELLKAIADGDPILQNAAKVTLEARKRLPNQNPKQLSPIFETRLGKLFNEDCLAVLDKIDDNSIDCIFADPPFNLAKNYGNGTTDSKTDNEYLEWTFRWLEKCVQKLKQGGAFFVYNIPKWNIHIAPFLNRSLNFKNWITIDITFSMPIPGRLYPSHYSLLYFVKGSKPSTFTPPRLPTKTCVRCGQEQSDYGGYKMKMNPRGINLRDVWTDIPPVRHNKNKNRDANELSVKLMDRVFDIATKEGDLIFDPFGGSGTSYIVAEIKGRRWIGSEVGSCLPIVERFDNVIQEKEKLKKIRTNLNTLFTDKAIVLRNKHGLPLDNFQISKEQIKRAIQTNSKEPLEQASLF